MPAKKSNAEKTPAVVEEKIVPAVEQAAPVVEAAPAVEPAPAEKPAAKKPGRKAVAKKADAPAAEEKKDEPRKAARKAAAKKAVPTIIIQSPMGGEITTEDILARVGAADKVYVRVDQNKAYIVRGEEADNIDLW